jgi:glycosyltransferase involved in cell wall biosynthesis
MVDKVPLFITRHSLSPRSAIGVQTRRLLEPHADWLHFHWWTAELRAEDARSILLESWLISRYSAFKRGGPLSGWVRRLQLSHWRDNRLHPRFEQRLVDTYADRVSCIYVAPLDREDASRCRSLLALFDVPFVLHIWDFLDGGLEFEEHRWLATHAAKVYCLAAPTLDQMSIERPDASELLFSRAPSASKSRAPTGKHLNVSLIGDIGSYVAGLQLLDAAIAILGAKGVTVEVQYVGSKRSFARAASQLQFRGKVLGFLPSAADRDAAMARCHVGFLPGPLADPDENLRSRYSIPSRTLDYLAVGLPIVGCVHPRSATGLFLNRRGIDVGPFNDSPGSLATMLESLLDEKFWAHQSDRSLRAFSMIDDPPPAQKLMRQMMDLPVRRPDHG